MNLASLEERSWIWLGYPDSAQRYDWRRQQIRDELNAALDELVDALPLPLSLIRETTLSVTAGTASWTLDDWCRRLIDRPYVVGSQAFATEVHWPSAADRMGLRSTSLAATDQPYDITLLPLTTTALLSGVGADATEGATTISKAADAPNWTTAAHVGKMIRLNGEDSDYRIVSVESVKSLTVDRPVRARLTGFGTTGVGAGYAAVPWCISPPGRCRIQLLPALTAAVTLYYRYVPHPRRLVYATDEPEAPAQYHPFLWKRAIRNLCGSQADVQRYGALAAECAELLEGFKKRDPDLGAAAVHARPHFATLSDESYLYADDGVRPRNPRGCQ
jgi:hypothetical protein